MVALTNTNGESASHLKMPFWIVISAKVFLPAVKSSFQFFMASTMNLMTFCISRIFSDNVLSRIPETYRRLSYCFSTPGLQFSDYLCTP